MNRQEFPSVLRRGVCQSIYHASFQKFIHRKDVVEKAGVSLRDIETAISDNLWEDLYGDE